MVMTMTTMVFLRFLRGSDREYERFRFGAFYLYTVRSILISGVPGTSSMNEMIGMPLFFVLQEVTKDKLNEIHETEKTTTNRNNHGLCSTPPQPPLPLFRIETEPATTTTDSPDKRGHLWS